VNIMSSPHRNRSGSWMTSLVSYLFTT
jgi:hypothetical protein